jgi:hypothetical protein
MDAIAAAIARPLRSLPFTANMAVIGALFLTPIALLIVVLFLQMNADATFYRSERVGVAYTKALRPLFADLETYRLADPAKRSELASRIDTDFTSAFAFDGGGGKSLALADATQRGDRSGTRGRRRPGLRSRGGRSAQVSESQPHGDERCFTDPPRNEA